MQCYFSNSSVRNCLAEYILIRLTYNGSQSSYKGNLFKLHICFIEEEEKKMVSFSMIITEFEEKKCGTNIKMNKSK
jgi:hypothetical protein